MGKYDGAIYRLQCDNVRRKGKVIDYKNANTNLKNEILKLTAEKNGYLDMNRKISEASSYLSYAQNIIDDAYSAFLIAYSSNNAMRKANGFSSVNGDIGGIIGQLYTITGESDKMITKKEKKIKDDNKAIDHNTQCINDHNSAIQANNAKIARLRSLND